MQIERLIYMANQIARNLASQGEGEAATQVAEHIRLFWDPRMKAQILSHYRAANTGLDPLVQQALAKL